MPSGKIHKQFNDRMSGFVLMLGLGVYSITIGIANSYVSLETIILLVASFVGYCVGYFLVARYIDPDADQLSLTISEGRLMREVGIFGFVVVWWMMPYAYIMKWFGGHRGVAHWHLIGTITRFMWLLWLPILLIVISGAQIPFLLWILAILSGVFIGVCVADSLHIWLDNHPPRSSK
jgi:uncharacterized metal-binding protein